MPAGNSCIGINRLAVASAAARVHEWVAEDNAAEIVVAPGCDSEPLPWLVRTYRDRQRHVEAQGQVFSKRLDFLSKLPFLGELNVCACRLTVELRVVVA